MNRLAIVFILCIFNGCISANSQTGIDGELKAKAEQSTNQSAGQESSNTNQSESSIIITDYYGSLGQVVSRTAITSAKTGSETNQQSDILNQMKQTLEMQEKMRAKAEANASMNFTYIFIGIIVLLVLYLLISGGSRVLAIVKKVKPI